MSKKKYKTKPIDYTGCNPVIVDHLKRGLAVECWCWDEVFDKGCKDLVLCIDTNKTYKYRAVNENYSNAEPIEIKTVLRKKKASEIVKWLEDKGYEFDGELWVSKSFVAQIYNSNIFLDCGKQVMKPMSWAPSEWYEEVEE